MSVCAQQCRSVLPHKTVQDQVMCSGKKPTSERRVLEVWQLEWDAKALGEVRLCTLLFFRSLRRRTQDQVAAPLPEECRLLSVPLQDRVLSLQPSSRQVDL